MTVYIEAPTPERALAYCEEQTRTKKPPHLNFTYFQRHKDASGLFLDIGAHAGQSVAYLSSIMPNVSFMAFEPNPLFAGCRDFLLSELGDRLQWSNKAVSDAEGTADLIVPKVTSEIQYTPGTATYMGPSSRASLSEAHFQKRGVLDSLTRHRQNATVEMERVTVETITIDSLKLAPSFVKIDVEGFEINVLRGMEQTIRKSHPIFMIEKNEHEEVISFLSNLGYTANSFIDGDLLPFEDHQSVNDIFFMP